jgi:hypothetical protein
MGAGYRAILLMLDLLLMVVYMAIRLMLDI